MRITRIFAGMMLFVWLGNSLPSLIAMTAPVEYCQMACCRGKSLLHSAESCPGKMSQMKMSPESMQDAEKPISAEHSEHNEKSAPEQEMSVAADFSAVPIYIAKEVLASDNNTFPFLQLKAAERCEQTACITNSSSGFGQRQSQSSDNCLLLSFADKPRPPSVVLINFKNQAGFNFTLQKLLHETTLSRGPPAFFS